MEININNDKTNDIIYYYNKCIDVILRLLERDTDREKEILNESTKKASESVIEILQNGIDVAMNKFN